MKNVLRWSDQQHCEAEPDGNSKLDVAAPATPRRRIAGLGEGNADVGVAQILEVHVGERRCRAVLEVAGAESRGALEPAASHEEAVCLQLLGYRAHLVLPAKPRGQIDP